MLVQLGDFTVAQASPDEDHPYLPDAAMALIGEYQRSPQFAAQAGPGEEDSTSASYTELPASYKPRPRRPPKGAARRRVPLVPAAGLGQDAPGLGRAGPRSGRP